MIEIIFVSLACFAGILAVLFLILPVSIGLAELFDLVQRPLSVIWGLITRRKQFPLFGNLSVIVTDACTDDSEQNPRFHWVGERRSGRG